MATHFLHILKPAGGCECSTHTKKTLGAAALLRLTLQLNETSLAVRRVRLCDSKTTPIPLPFRGWLDASQRNPVRTRKHSTCTRKAINHELHRNDPIQGSRYLHIGVLHHPRPDSGSHSGSGTERRFSTIRQSAGPFGKPDLQHGGQSTAGHERRQHKPGHDSSHLHDDADCRADLCVFPGRDTQPAFLDHAIHHFTVGWRNLA